MYGFLVAGGWSMKALERNVLVETLGGAHGFEEIATVKTTEFVSEALKNATQRQQE